MAAAPVELWSTRLSCPQIHRRISSLPQQLPSATLGEPENSSLNSDPGCIKVVDTYRRLFCHITQTWRGKPLTSRLAVVELIAATTTTTGLKVHCELAPRCYPKGIKVTDGEMSSLNITGDKFHPEWNYTIAPRVPT